jgi:hypothetical protein
MKFA